MTLGKLLNLFQPQVSQLKIEIITHLNLNDDKMHCSCKTLSIGLIHSKGSMNISWYEDSLGRHLGEFEAVTRRTVLFL